MQNMDPEEIKEALGLEGSCYRRRVRFWLISAAVLAVFISGMIWAKPGENAPVRFETAPVEKGGLTIEVTATGALEPVNRVDVGSEVSGTLKEVNADFNDRVKKGEILAVLDTTRLEAGVNQSRAALEAARARLAEAEASVLESRREFERLKKAWEISGGKLPSRNELDVAEAAFKRSLAAEISAKAQIIQAEGVLKADQYDLDRAVIRSPVDGIILERLVEPGQTVAASLQAPVLFTLAEDLTRMQLKVKVDEADVGKITEGQHAVFTVDAYPEEEFSAVISEVRFSGQVENGVVTYETLLSVENPDLLLRPGMTATAEIRVQNVKDALLVPNAALRFLLPSGEKNADSRSFLDKLMPRTSRRSSRPERPAVHTPGTPGVFVLRDDKPVKIPVITGITDGIRTTIKKSDLQPGDRVVIGMSSS